MIVAGIDPGKSSGLAVYTHGTLTDLITNDFWGVIGWIDLNPHAVFVVELPNTKSVWHKDAKARGAIERTGVNVGSCLREAELIIKYLGINGCQTIIEKPAGKVDSANFKDITGWNGRTNQHMRDACLLAHKYRNIKL
jgi:hypothetical protein